MGKNALFLNCFRRTVGCAMHSAWLAPCGRLLAAVCHPLRKKSRGGHRPGALSSQREPAVPPPVVSRSRRGF